MSDMDNFLGDQIAKAYEREPVFDRLQNRGLRQVNADQADALHAKSSYAAELQRQLTASKEQLAQASQELAAARNRQKKAERAEAQYREAYRNQMETMAEWMLSQKAFKELAIQFGFQQGLSADQAIALGNQKKLDVLDNKHHPEHGSNANGLPFLEERAAGLRNKLLNE